MYSRVMRSHLVGEWIQILSISIPDLGWCSTVWNLQLVICARRMRSPGRDDSGEDDSYFESLDDDEAGHTEQAGDVYMETL